MSKINKIPKLFVGLQFIFLKGEEEVDNDIFNDEENENSWEDELHQENSDVEKTSG